MRTGQCCTRHGTSHQPSVHMCTPTDLQDTPPKSLSPVPLMQRIIKFVQVGNLPLPQLPRSSGLKCLYCLSSLSQWSYTPHLNYSLNLRNYIFNYQSCSQWCYNPRRRSHYRAFPKNNHSHKLLNLLRRIHMPGYHNLRHIRHFPGQFAVRLRIILSIMTNNRYLTSAR